MHASYWKFKSFLAVKRILKIRFRFDEVTAKSWQSSFLGHGVVVMALLCPCVWWDAKPYSTSTSMALLTNNWCVQHLITLSSILQCVDQILEVRDVGVCLRSWGSLAVSLYATQEPTQMIIHSVLCTLCTPDTVKGGWNTVLVYYWYQ